MAQPAASLQTLADYLRVGFWQDAGTVPRRYNLGSGSSGPNPNVGELRYNLSGWNFDTDRNGTPDGDSNGLTVARRALVREVFKLYEATLGIRFVETSATDDSVDFFFTDNRDGAYAYAAGNSYESGVDYSVINVAESWNAGISSFASYTVQTFLHEIGHALGLGQQGPYNGSGNYGTDARFANDSWQESMMSYFSQTDNPTTGSSFAFLQSPMSVDWRALDDIYRPAGYGVGNAFRGDTVYGVGTNISATTSRIWNEFSLYAGRSAYTIIDSDGYDTLDVSNFSGPQLINLARSQPFSTRPSLSNIGGKIGNLSIAAGTFIEAAIGGSGNDTFYGNMAANTLRGRAGNDTFYDSRGSDIYYGGANVDQLFFRDPIDLFHYEVSGDSLLFSRVAGSLDVDRVWNNIETLSFAGVPYSYGQLVQRLAAPLASGAAGNTVRSTPTGQQTNFSSPASPAPVLYFSLGSGVFTASPSVMGGLTAGTNDIIAFDGSRFTTWLNGNASGLGGAVLGDFHVIGPDQVVVAFQSPVTLAGIAFDDSDLALLNRNRSGGFDLSLFLDGSAVGLTTDGEAIDAVTGLADGSWLISTRGGGSVPVGSASLSFGAEDILRFTPSGLGPTTAGTWSLHADMSDVGITGTGENVTALAAAADGRLFATTGGNAAATGLTAANEDVFVFRPTSLGATTSGSFEGQLCFDGSQYGLGPNALMGIALPV